MRAWALAAVAAVGCGGAASVSPTPPDLSTAAVDAGGPGPDLETPFVTAPHRLMPQLPPGNGHTLHPVRVVTVTAADDPLAAKLDAFGDEVVKSDWLNQWAAEYNLLPAAGSFHVSGPAPSPGASQTQAQLEKYVRDAITTDGSLALNGNTVYVLYVPPTVTYPGNAGNGGAGGCGGDSYHRAFAASMGGTSIGDQIAFVTRCAGTSAANPLDPLTQAASHEVAESITDAGGGGWVLRLAPGTDPWTNSVWTENEGSGTVEIADLCGGSIVTEDGYNWVRIFSNRAAAAGGDPCAPPLPVAYYNTTTDSDWYAGAPGSTVDISVTGWSTAPSEDWIVEAQADAKGTNTTRSYGLELDSPTSTILAGKGHSTINNGRVATLHVAVPAGAQSGDWMLVNVLSLRLGLDGKAVPGEDLRHRILVGVHVP